MKKGFSQNLSMLLLTFIFIHVILTDCMVYFVSLEYITANVVVVVGEVIFLRSSSKRKWCGSQMNIASGTCFSGPCLYYCVC